MQTLKQILSSALDIPVERPSYRGNAPKYIIYHVIGQSGTIYAEGREAETGVSFALDLYSDGSYLDILRKIQTALWDAGIASTVEMEDYDNDTEYYHVAMIARRVGANYG